MSNHWQDLKDSEEARKSSYWTRILDKDAEKAKATMPRAQFLDWLQERRHKLEENKKIQSRKTLDAEAMAPVKVDLLFEPDTEKNPGHRIENLLPLQYFTDPNLANEIGGPGMVSGAHVGLSFTALPGQDKSIFVKNPNSASAAELNLTSLDNAISVTHPASLSPGEISEIKVHVEAHARGSVRAGITGRVRWSAIR